jgi:tetratricopeptide (TPR) repeat protein
MPTFTTRLRWENDTLYFGLHSRACPRTEIKELEQQLTKRLQDKDWDLEEVKKCGHELWKWLDGTTHQWLGPIQTERRQARAWCLEISGTLGALSHLPWEALHDENGFLAATTPLFMPVRRVDDAKGDLTAAEAPPYGLSILFMAAAPTEERLLSFEAEEARLLASLGSLLPRKVFLQIEESGTIEGLKDRSALLDQWSVTHLTCHGKHNPPTISLENNLGNRDLVTPEKLLAEGNLQNRSVVFVSACLSAERNPTSEDSFITALVRGGLSAALGFAAKVPDSGATEAAAKLYTKLARSEDLLQALAEVRREGASDPKGDPRVWASLRYVASQQLGRLCPAEATRKPFPVGLFPGDQAALNTRERTLKVASRARFVGRRRCLQRLIRAIEGEEHLGVLVLGIGGAGKSSLVSRAVSRVRHSPIVIFQKIERGEILLSLRDQYFSALSRILSDEEIKQALADESIYRSLLERCFRHEALQEKPALFILDDAEARLQEDPESKGMKPTDEAKITIQRLVEALEAQQSASRLVITSRYAFSVVDRKGLNLLERLDRIDLVSLSALEAERLLLQAERYDEDGKPRIGALNEVLLTRCAKSVGSNPRLLVLLHTLLSQNKNKGEEVLAQVEEYLRSGTQDKASEEVNKYLGNLALGALLQLAGEEGRRVLRLMTLFPVPVPLSSVATAAKIGRDGLLRLVDISLLEHHSEELLFVPALVRPLLTPLETEERKTFGSNFLENLPEGWREDSRGEWSGPFERATFLYQLCKETSFFRASLARAVGAVYLWRVVNSGNFKEARKESDYLDQLGESFMISALLHNAWASDNKERASIYLTKARVHLPSDASPSEKFQLLIAEAEVFLTQGNPDKALLLLDELKKITGPLSIRLYAITLGQIAGIKQQKGDNEGALLLYEESLKVLEELGDRRSRAITLGNIATIKRQKGDIDGALLLYHEKLKIIEEIGDRRSRFITLGNIAEIKLDKGDIDEALLLFYEELKIYEELGDRRSYAITLGNIAKAKQHKGNVDEALLLLYEKLKTAEDLGNLEIQANARWEIGKIQKQQGKFEEAIRHLQFAFDTLIKIQRPDVIDAVGRDLSLIYLRTNQRSEVVKVMLRSNEAFSRLGRQYEATQILSMFSDSPKSPNEEEP